MPLPIWIRCRPSSAVHRGQQADTLYFTEDAYRRAREPKKIHVVEGASHVDLYDKPEYVTQVVEALKEFFGKAL